MDKMKMHSPNLTQENIANIREMFPNCVTEARDEVPGQLRLLVDFDQLKQELSDHIVDGPQERYRLDWPGKREALVTANTPIAKTLRPCRAESMDFDTTQNLFIEGDNLEALKLLQETYLGRVKFIYIDPPYNTGSDLVYDDDFSDVVGHYLIKSNQQDETGNRLVTNTDSNGRFHSDWLNMLYPRLKLARNLLARDGFILVSIDDNEFANLKSVLDELFGADQYIGTFTVNSTPNARDYGHMGKMHEYAHFYCRSKGEASSNQLEVEDKKFTYVDNRGEFNIHPLYNSNEAFNSQNRPNLYYPFYIYKDEMDKQGFYKIGLEERAHSIKVFPPRSEKNKVQFVWRWSKNKSIENINKEIVGHRTSSGNFRIVQKMRHTTKLIRSILDSKDFTSRRGTAEVESIFKQKIASFPKPVDLIKTLTKVCTNQDSIVLDFFAGSSTTAHAVMKLNAEDGGNRKFIMAQIPEICDKKSEAFKAGYKTIAEIGKERIRRAGAIIFEGEFHPDWNRDVGFRTLKVDTSNMKDVYYRPDDLSQAKLLTTIDNIKPDRTPEDLLFQVLVDWGVDLTLPIRRKTVQGKTVFFVDNNALVACFDRGITEDLVKELAKHEPARVVFRDNGFISDAVKINVEQIFRQLSATTQVKAI